jgi:glycosyltransferase involved in cell wall biosynthesis
LYAGVADLLAAKGIETYVAYTCITEAPRPLQGSHAVPLSVDASLGSVSSILAVIRVIRRERIDAMYFTDVATWHWALPLLRLAGVRWIVSHDHTSGHRDAARGVKRAMKWVRSRLPGVTADRILTVSEYVARRQREVALAPPRRVFPILNGLAPPPLTSADDEAPEQLADPRRPLVVCACRAAAEKGVDVLMCAFDILLSDWEPQQPRPLLVYIGDGPAMGALRELKESLPATDDIRLLGYRQDVERWLRRAAVCVVPSVWEDACPLSVLEAMALGKAVVASAVGGVPEEINSPAVGILVPKGDPQRLASAMRELLLDEDRRKQIGMAARRRIERELTREGHLRAIVAHLTADYGTTA